MNRKAFWAIFALTQFVGALGMATGSPHGNPFGLIFALIFLFPGSILSFFILDKLGIQTTVSPIIVASFLINILSWYAVALGTNRLRGKKSN